MSERDPKTKDNLLVLATRCETEPGSMGLSRSVALALGWGKRKEPGKKAEWFHPRDMHENGHIAWDSLHGTEVWREPLDYTRNLEAVKEIEAQHSDWMIEVTTHGNQAAARICSAKTNHELHPRASIIGEHAEPRARLAAALRALADTEGETSEPR